MLLLLPYLENIIDMFLRSFQTSKEGNTTDFYCFALVMGMGIAVNEIVATFIINRITIRINIYINCNEGFSD